MTTKTDKPEEQIESLYFEPGVANRLFGLLEGFLQASDLIPAMYHGVILNFVKPYLKKTNDLELAKQIAEIREKIIPFLLTGK